MLPKSFSHSSLGTYRNCPRQFKFQYIEKPVVRRKVSPQAFLGTAVHKALRHLYKMGADGVVWPENDVVEFYQKEWDKVDPESLVLPSEHYTVDDFIRIGREVLVRHYRKYKPFKHGVILGSELSLKFTLPETPFVISAKIDRLSKKDDGSLEICDYKTGQHMLQTHDLDFRFQMGLYQLAVQDAYPQFHDIDLVQIYLRQDEEVACRMSPDELDELTEQVRLTLAAIVAAERNDNFPPTESALCAYCNYEELCPARRHRFAMEVLEKEDSDGSTPEERAAEKAEAMIGVHLKIKEFEAEKRSLKEDLVELARELDMSKFFAKSGRVDVRISQEEKLVTRTADQKAHADLNALVNGWEGMDLFFELNGNEFMKKVYLTGRLTDEQRDQLEEYIKRGERVVVIPRPSRKRFDNE